MGRTVQILERHGRNYLREVADTWNRFWFSPRDPFAMCVMRILVGWMAFYTILVWGMRLDSFFNEDGFNSMRMIQNHLLEYEGPFALSFWYWVPEGWVYPVHYLSLAITFCFMIGLFTRVTSILSLVVLISYAYRARYANYGLDQINAILTLYLCIAPSGAYLSVDRWWKNRQAKKRELHLQSNTTAVQPTIATNIATRMTQLHYCVIYLAAGTGKLLGDSWWDGTAIWRSLANAEYQTLDMTWLAFYPWFTELVTHTTVAWELTFAFLVWRPLLRPWVLLIGAGMHFGIGLMMGMWTFGFCMMFGYLAFLDPLKLKMLLEYVRGRSFTRSSETRRETGATSRPAPVSRQGFDRVVLFDRHAETSRGMMASLSRQGYTVQAVSSLDDLLGALEYEPNTAVVANLQKVSDEDAEQYLTSLLAVNLENRPCVTLLKRRHSRFVASAAHPPYQRFRVLPCDEQQVLRELDQATTLLSGSVDGEDYSESRGDSDRLLV